MSNNSNTIIMDEAREWADVYVDTTLGGMYDLAINAKDLDRLRELNNEARQMERDCNE